MEGILDMDLLPPNSKSKPEEGVLMFLPLLINVLSVGKPEKEW